MPTSLDYLRFRGDLNLTAHPFNSLDASLLSSIVYWPMVKQDVGHSFKEIATRLTAEPSFQHELHDETKELIDLVLRSPRIGSIILLDLRSKLQKEPALQFTAITVKLTTNEAAVIYRGTDSSLIGWHEDMVMNYTSEIFGQSVAKDYLKDMLNKFRAFNFYVCGHSKGGNYALYSVSTLKPADQDRIISAINFDGPGFRKEIYRTECFQQIMPKMKTYLPEGSIIGAMLDHPERVLVTRCDAVAFGQHDPRRWFVARDSFALAPGLSNTARILRHSLINFNHTIPAGKREQMWSALFDAFDTLDITDLNQLREKAITGTMKFGQAYLAMDPEMRSIFRAMFEEIIKTAGSNLVGQNRDRYDSFPPSSDSKLAPVFFEFYD